jgi:ArsR family transcriptional regulator, virulence genes transcriptional regulator
MTEYNDELIEIQASYCSTFSNPSRLRIMLSLRDGELSVTEIADKIGIHIQAASQHLRIMKDRNVLKARKDGREVYYQITNEKFIAACNLIREALLEEEKKRSKAFV